MKWLPLVLMLACTASQAVAVTGESLIALGPTFIATGKLMDAALDSKAVTVEQYRGWASFARRFSAVYPPALDTYSAAMKVDDHNAIQQSAILLAGLSAELAAYSSLVEKKP